MAPRSEYARSEYYEEEPDASFDDDGDEGDYSQSHSRSASTAPTDDAGYFVTQAERSMNRLHELHASTDWKKVLKHRKGVVVSAQKRGGAVYRGQLVIKGYSPAAVFAVVGTRKLWDEWYESGSLVDNLNDTTSLTYMVMKGIMGSTTRDLSLVEKVAGSQDGAICFVSTSVESAKVPRVSGRVRAHIGLNGWVLEPMRNGGPTSTQVSYYLQVNVKTFVPKAITGKYLARRPACISRIDDYLQKNGAPPLAGVDAAEQQPARSSETRSNNSYGAAAGGAAAGAAAGAAVGGARKRRPSMTSTRSGKSTAASSGFLSAPSIVEDHKSSADLNKARDKFEELIGDNGRWEVAQDHRGARFQMRDGKGAFPTIRANTKIEGVTTEQVLSTILSTPARRLWDDRWMSNDLVEPVNGHEHGIYVETIKGIFPHISNRYFVVARGVEREDPTSPSSTITYLARSTDSAEPKKKPSGTKATLDVAGWRLEDEGNESVAVEHIVQSDLRSDKITPALKKTMVVSVAKAPRLLSEFIDERGYAPYFVRWEEGDAHLDRDDGDLLQRKAEFYISSGSVKNKGSGEQRTWFQWSERMYDRGISLRLEPSDAASVAKVSGLERTVEFSWNASKVGKEAVLYVEPYDRGDGGDDVMLDGELLDRTVQAAEVADAAPVKKPKKDPRRANKDSSKSDVGRDAAEGAVAGAAGGAAAAAVSNRKKDSSSNDDRSSARDSSGGGGSRLPPPVAAVAPKTIDRDEKTGKRALPSDAMIIVSDDLYFTRSQVSAIAVLLAVVFVMGKVL